LGGAAAAGDEVPPTSPPPQTDAHAQPDPATEPEFAPGPGPYAFDCDSPPGKYDQLNIHASGTKLKVSGNVRVLEWRTHEKWAANADVSFRGAIKSDWVAIQLFVMPWAAKTVQIAVHDNSQKAQERTVFASTPVTDRMFHFELTLDGSGRLVASFPGASKSVNVTPYEVTRLHLGCSTAHAQFSDVTVSSD